MGVGAASQGQRQGFPSQHIHDPVLPWPWLVVHHLCQHGANLRYKDHQPICACAPARCGQIWIILLQHGRLGSPGSGCHEKVHLPLPDPQQLSHDLHHSYGKILMIATCVLFVHPTASSIDLAMIRPTVLMIFAFAELTRGGLSSVIFI